MLLDYSAVTPFFSPCYSLIHTICQAVLSVDEEPCTFFIGLAEENQEGKEKRKKKNKWKKICMFDHPLNPIYGFSVVTPEAPCCPLPHTDDLFLLTPLQVDPVTYLMVGVPNRVVFLKSPINFKLAGPGIEPGT